MTRTYDLAVPRLAALSVIALLMAGTPASAQVSVEGQFASVPSGAEAAYYGALGVTSCSDQSNATNRISLRFDDRGDVQGDFEVRIEGSTTCDAFNRCDVLAAMTGKLEGGYDQATGAWDGTFEASARIDVVFGCEGDEAQIQIPLADVGVVPAGTEVPITAPWSAAVDGTILRGRLNAEEGPGLSLTFEAPGDAITPPSTSSTTPGTTEPQERDAAETAFQSSDDDGGDSGGAWILVVAGAVVTGLGVWWTLARRRQAGASGLGGSA